jgi:hypothetical protein
MQMSDSLCATCSQPFAEEDIVILNGTSEQVQELRQKLEAKKRLRRKDKAGRKRKVGDHRKSTASMLLEETHDE